MLTADTSISGFKDCDIVIEAAVERMDLKQKIIVEIETVLPSHAIFATNTSSLSVSLLAKSSIRPNQVVDNAYYISIAYISFSFRCVACIFLIQSKRCL